jgi:anti-sigma factor RsiW
MKTISCGAVRRRLQAFHDVELPVSDQIAVGAHIEACAPCAEALADLTDMRDTLVALAPGRLVLSNDEAAAFSATVVSRLKAEDEASWLSRARAVFDDMHFVYAGLGAAASTIVFVGIALGMMRFADRGSLQATNERPDSLAAIVSLVSSPVSCESGADVTEGSGCRARWEARFQRAAESAKQDDVFALDAVVTHQGGRLTSLERLRKGRRSTAEQAELIEGLMDSVCRSRLEVGPTPGAAAQSSMLLLVERATVRAGKADPLPSDQPPVSKKRADLARRASISA